MVSMVVVLLTTVCFVPGISGYIGEIGQSQPYKDVTESNMVFPHPIFGTATWEGGGNADDAIVEVSSSLGVLTTIVGPAGGYGSGEWQIDCGDPGADWPEGTSFTVTITGTGSHEGWSGNATGIVSGYYNDMGNIVLSQDTQNQPPKAYIDSISPNPATEEDAITFEGHGVDNDGTIITYTWQSSLDGLLSTKASFTSSNISTGVHEIYFKVEDDDHTWSFADIETLIIKSPNSNLPPEKPSITGETNGKIGEIYNYTFTTSDPDGDKVYYYIEWGDDSVEEWIGPYNSGEEITLGHTFAEEGRYTIQAKAKDILDEESEWATLKVTMPKNKAINPFLLFLERLIERFPIMEQILQPIYDKLTGL